MSETLIQNNKDLNKIKKFERDIIEKIKLDKPEILESIQSSVKLEEDIEKTLIKLIDEYKKGNE